MVLATRVFVGFEPIRIKLVKAPLPAGGVTHVPITDARIDALQPPFAVIVRVQHRSAAPQRFVIRLDDQPVCESTVAGGASRRIDCSVRQPVRGGSGHGVSIESPADGWQLESAEVSTHHGNTSGGITAYVLPAASGNYTRPSAAWVAVAWLAIAGVLFLAPGYRVNRRVSLASRALALAVAALFGLIAIVPLALPYLVVLSAGTFAGCVILPTLPLVAYRLWLAREEPFAQRAAAWWRTLNQTWTLSPAAARRSAWGLALLLCGVGLFYGTRALGGADTYGYISQADLWLRGDLKIDQTFATRPPWPKPEATFAPLGYSPSRVDSRLIVPIYSPGLPIVLAAAKRLGGQQAMFWIVPICGGLLVLATFGLGRRLGSDAAGLIAAWLVATSPVVLSSVVITMTDVPVSAAWAGAFYLLLGTGLRSAAGAGLLSGAAILIRPNLAPLAGVMALHYLFRLRDPLTRRQSAIALVFFGTAVLPGVLAVAAINQHLFGSPFSSGYGSIDRLFSPARILVNLQNYVSWLIESHTVVVLCGLAAIVVPLRRLWPATRDRRVFPIIATFVFVVWAIYCMWLVFDGWWFLRFLLPTWPFMMLGVAAVAMALLRTAGPSTRPLVVFAVLALGGAQLHFAIGRGVLLVGRGEGRNVAIARLAARVTPPGSVSLTCIHSGSLRYYGGRMTLNCGQFDGGLDRTVEWLTARGVHVYAVLEDWELPEFERRFAGAAALAALKQPIAIYKEPGHTVILDLSSTPSGPIEPVVVTGLERSWVAVPPAAPPTLVLKEEP